MKICWGKTGAAGNRKQADREYSRMHAGVVKTPLSGRKKDAAVPAKSAEKTASGGKKFVQTRLPFKLLTPGGGAVPTSSSSSSSPVTTGSGPVTVILDEDDPAPRKRKLSYDDESPSEGTGCSTGQLRRSTSKENLDLASSIATKKVKTTDSVVEDVIELDEDEADKEMKDQDQVVEAKPSKEVKSKPKKSEAKKGSPAPIQIKLPLVNKRSKRRKSLKKSEEPLETSTADVAKGDSESSDDIEIIAEELNPQKRQKVQTPSEKSPENSSTSGKHTEEVMQKNGKDSKKQESKKEEPKTAEQNKKNDQATIDLFMGKKVETNKKDKPEVKTTAKDNKKDPLIAEDSKPKEVPKKETSKTGGKGKKEGAKPAEKSKKEEKEDSTTKSKKEKADSPANNQKEQQIGAKKKTSEPEDASNSHKSVTAKKDSKKDEASTQVKSDNESPEAAEISMILSTSEANSSSSEHEMDADTDTAATDRPSAQKETRLNRKSLPEVTGAPKGLTPKQQRLMEQRKKAREEKEQKLAEERRLKQQDKEHREQQKKQERDEKEQQRKLERDQKEQQRKMEKEEKERKRQAEVDSKNEEKRKRNEAKEEVQRKKDEERRKKEQEREEAEQKKKRAAESFSKFFVPKQPKCGSGSNNTSYLEHEQSSCDSSKASSQTLAFRPFQIKDDMLLAPIVRNSLGQEQRSQLDGLFRHRDEEADDEVEEEEQNIVRRKPPNRANLYLSELSSGRRKPLKMQRDVKLQRRTKDEEDDDDVQVIGRIWLQDIKQAFVLHQSSASTDYLSPAGLPIEVEQPKQLTRMKAKYLHFADNRRPPYYGTWRKKSSSISARRPLAQDKVWITYSGLNIITQISIII